LVLDGAREETMPVKDDLRTDVTQGQFLAGALRRANDKARELG